MQNLKISARPENTFHFRQSVGPKTDAVPIFWCPASCRLSRPRPCQGNSAWMRLLLSSIYLSAKWVQISWSRRQLNSKLALWHFFTEHRCICDKKHVGHDANPPCNGQVLGDAFSNVSTKIIRFYFSWDALQANGNFCTSGSDLSCHILRAIYMLRKKLDLGPLFQWTSHLSDSATENLYRNTSTFSRSKLLGIMTSQQLDLHQNLANLVISISRSKFLKVWTNVQNYSMCD